MRKAVTRQWEGGNRNPGMLTRWASLAITGMLIAACSATPAASSPAASSPAASSPAAGSPAASGDTGNPTIGNGKKQIAWAIALHDLSVIAQMDQIMTDYAAERGWQQLLDQGTGGNIQAMTASVQSWITQGVPCMTVTSDDPSAVAPLQKQALEKGLIWNVYGTQDMPTNNHAFVGFPATEAGAKGAEVVVKHIQDNDPDAKVLILTQVTNPGGKPREDLPKQAIEEQTEATIVAEQDGSDQAKGLQSTQAALQANPDLSVVVSRTDAGALGAAQAFKQAGIAPEDVFILTYDGSLQSLQELRDENYIKVIVALDLKLLAETVTQTCIDMALSGPPPERVEKIVPTDIIDKDAPKLAELIEFYESGG